MRSASGHHDVNESRSSLASSRNGLGQCVPQASGFEHRAHALHTLRLGQLREIHGRVIDVDPDVHELLPSASKPGHGGLMETVLPVGPVVFHHEQDRQAMMGSGPQG